MEKSVYSPEVYEDAVFSDVFDDTFHDLAFMKVLKCRLSVFFAVFFKNDPSRQYNIVSLLAVFQYLEIKGLPNQLIKVPDGPNIHLRTRQECLHADINGQTAPDSIDNNPLNDAVGFVRILDLVPDLHLGGFFLGKGNSALVFFPSFKQHVHSVPDCNMHFAVLVPKLPDVDLSF